MDEQASQKTLNDPNFQQTVFNNLMEVFIVPNIKRRQEKGELPIPLPLMAAQLLLYPDERPTELRVNEEVRAVANMKLKDGIQIAPGDPVYEHQLEWAGNFKLAEEDDPDCGYIIVVLINGMWTGNFSFLYNKGLSRKHLAAARQYCETAKYAHEHKYWSVFVDTLFSACELAVKALMLGHRPELRTTKKHEHVHSVFNQFARDGNVDPAQQETFNKLTKLRPTARYLHEDVGFTVEEANHLLTTVETMIQELEVSFAE